MCGIAGIFGENWTIDQLESMVSIQRHRGPDAEGVYINTTNQAGMGHNRLSIIDLSDAGRQPMASADGNYKIVFNGEIYNYLELRRELESDFDFRTKTDTEVLLAAYQKWGTSFLDRLIGMFAFIIWDERGKKAFAARDRFGVKPLYFHEKPDGTLFLASEIKAIHQAGIKRRKNKKTWATFLTHGLIDHSSETFWQGIDKIPAGHFLVWKNGRTHIKKWYDLAEKSGAEFDARSAEDVREEYLELLKDSVRLRFRSDVTVGINLSGGVDSSALLGLVHALEKDESAVTAYTFATGDARYDELPWVRQMLDKTAHPLIVSTLEAREVPALAASVQHFQDEPFGGIPTLAYAKLFETARENKTIVLLDGNGLDEQWAGYNYYADLSAEKRTNIVQGLSEKPTRADCLIPEFRALAANPVFPEVFPDKLRNTQYRDACLTKIPRSMRYNDRISMRVSTELREPFLDQRLFELALRQTSERKINNGIHKKMLREIIANIVPSNIRHAPKRALQTPQREWLGSVLKSWANDLIHAGLNEVGGDWLDKTAVLHEWKKYNNGESDNSFYIWQWISIGLMRGQFSPMEKNFELHGYQSSIACQAI